MNIIEVDTVINKIQQEIYEDLQPQMGRGNYISAYPELITLSYHSNGDTIYVEFLGIQIWNSDDGRQSDETTDEYEPLEIFIRREVKRLIDVICLIKLEAQV